MTENLNTINIFQCNAQHFSELNQQQKAKYRFLRKKKNNSKMYLNIM